MCLKVLDSNHIQHAIMVLMVKKSKATKKFKKPIGLQDSSFLLKVVLYLIIGSIWCRITNSAGSYIPLPVGLLIGIIFASHEHFQVDRKIEYTLLALSAFIGFWLPIGITIVL